MRTPTVRRPLALLAATGLVLGAAACGSDDGAPAAADADADADADVNASTTSIASTTSTTSTTLVGGGATGETGATTTVPPETTTIPAETTTTAPPLPDCTPVGDWRLREQEYLDELSVLAGGGGGIGFSHGGGAYFVTIRPDGTYLGERESWQIRLESPEGTIVTTIDSDDEGTWSVDGERISMSDPGSPATVSFQVEIGGVLQDLPGGGPRLVGSGGISGSGTFACEGDTLRITVDELPDLPPDTTLTAVFDPV